LAHCRSLALVWATSPNHTCIHQSALSHLYTYSIYILFADIEKNYIDFFPPFISFLPTAQAAQQAHVQIQASTEALNTAALQQTQTTQMKSLISGRQDVPAPPELPHSTSNLAGVLLDGGRGSPVE
jgi:hypothetical protein